MVALMNQVGFNASTLGNHEFDSHQDGMAKLISLSNFRHICANIQPDPEWGIHCIPYQIFDVEGVKVGVVGVVQLGTRGIPDSHPDNVKGISFLPVKETVQKHAWLREKCDVTILLTHIGYEDDVELSKDVPWVDLIIGGHPHVVEPMEVRYSQEHDKNVLLVYSMGNFISNQSDIDTRGGAMVKVSLRMQNDHAVIVEPRYKLFFVQKPVARGQNYVLIPEARPDLLRPDSKAEFTRFMQRTHSLVMSNNIGVENE